MGYKLAEVENQSMILVSYALVLQTILFPDNAHYLQFSANEVQMTKQYTSLFSR